MNETGDNQLFEALWPQLRDEDFASFDYKRVSRFFRHQKDIVTAELELPSIEHAAHKLASLINGLKELNRESLIVENALSVTRTVLPNAPASADVLLKLALRTQLTLDIRFTEPVTSKHPGDASAQGTYHVTWNPKSTLLEAVQGAFDTKQKSHSASLGGGKINPRLTMAFLCSRRNFTIIWTWNLFDHLNIDWKERTITVYEHKIYLWNHLRHSTEPVIPRAILGEAIDTLNLLFPSDDRRTNSLLEEDGKPFNSLGDLGRDWCYNLEDFHYWRDRLADLMHIMSEEPMGLRQLALSDDGRNFLQFMTFWVAVAVAILTIISIASGTASTVYAAKQYHLAVAQACSIPDARNALSAYCS